MNGSNASKGYGRSGSSYALANAGTTRADPTARVLLMASRRLVVTSKISRVKKRLKRR
jgi:hypothetical protein